MISAYFIYFYVFTVGVLWLFLSGFTMYQTSTPLLQKKGYKEQYIKFLKKDSKKRAFSIAVFIPLVLLLSGFVIWLIFGELSRISHLIYLCIITFICIIPFPIIDTRRTNQKYKELAVQTKSDIMIDLNYRTLHLVFKPSWEIIAAILYVAYFAIFFRSFNPASVHFIILWLFYASAKSGRYMVQPLLKSGYVYIFSFMLINHVLLIVHAAWQMLLKQGQMAWLHYLFGGILVMLLVGKLIYYLGQYPQLKRQLTAGNEARVNAAKLNI